MPQMPPDNVTPAERLAGQDWSGVAKHGLMAMAPAEKGWLLAVVVMFGTLMLVDYFETVRQLEASSKRTEEVNKYLGVIEANREKAEDTRAQEVRRLQEIVKELAQTVSRQANRAGRQMTSAQAVDQLLQGAQMKVIPEAETQ